MIVMLTNVIEGGKVKCEHYWPAEGFESYGPITVTVVNQKIMPSYITRTLSITVLQLLYYSTVAIDIYSTDII